MAAAKKRARRKTNYRPTGKRLAAMVAAILGPGDWSAIDRRLAEISIEMRPRYEHSDTEVRSSAAEQRALLALRKTAAIQGKVTALDQLEARLALVEADQTEEMSDIEPPPYVGSERGAGVH